MPPSSTGVQGSGTGLAVTVKTGGLAPLLEFTSTPSVVSPEAGVRSRLAVLPAVASVRNEDARPSVHELLPLVPLPIENVPSDWSDPGVRYVDWSVEYVIPVVVGAFGVPVPSVHDLFCIQVTEKEPA